MPILLSRDEFDSAMKEIKNILNNILQYQENFDNEIFSSLQRIEDKISLSLTTPVKEEVKKVIPLKKK